MLATLVAEGEKNSKWNDAISTSQVKLVLQSYSSTKSPPASWLALVTLTLRTALPAALIDKLSTVVSTVMFAFGVLPTTSRANCKSLCRSSTTSTTTVLSANPVVGKYETRMTLVVSIAVRVVRPTKASRPTSQIATATVPSLAKAGVLNVTTVCGIKLVRAMVRSVAPSNLVTVDPRVISTTTSVTLAIFFMLRRATSTCTPPMSETSVGTVRKTTGCVVGSMTYSNVSGSAAVPSATKMKVVSPAAAAGTWNETVESSSLCTTLGINETEDPDPT
mmetsp:Transcript_6744/g.10379  ORF Transcript_6744/g.10379 Transcript_6744/m.10379 type:complete len:277 (+) Transcript_6744:9487-10317(+)